MVGTRERPRPREVTQAVTQLAPRYTLILLDDDDHTYEYVIEMLCKLFAVTEQEAFILADTVHTEGRAIIYTGPLETVEFKQQRVHAYGADPRILHCAGSMTAVIEAVDS